MKAAPDQSTYLQTYWRYACRI